MKQENPFEYPEKYPSGFKYCFDCGVVVDGIKRKKCDCGKVELRKVRMPCDFGSFIGEYDG